MKPPAPGAPPSAIVTAGLMRHQRVQRRRTALVIVLAVVALATFLLDVLTGPSGLNISTAWRAFTGQLLQDDQANFIVWQLRLPQALLAVLVGAALGIAGAEMQTILENPLADPFTLGVSSAAALGAALAIVIGIGIPGVPEDWIVAGNAFFFALASLIALLLLARAQMAGTERIILFGIAMGFTFGALLSLLQFIASPDALQQLTFWSMGSLVRANWEVVSTIALATAFTLPFSYRCRWQMNVLRLGQDRAKTLGVDIRLLRFGALVRVSLLASVSVSFAGIIGFVGLTGPHIARMLVGEDYRFLLPASGLVSVIVMSLAAIVSKSAMPGVIIPIGIVTALVGLPAFFSLIAARRDRI